MVEFKRQADGFMNCASLFTLLTPTESPGLQA
jgi:hypothetical protein